MIRKFTNSFNPVALYNFNRNLRDSSLNGLHLTGTATFRHIWPNLVGIVAGSPARLTNDPLLTITGDMTVQVIAVQRLVSTNAQVATFIASGETEATNALWQLDLESQTVLQWFSESVAGVNADHTVSDATITLPTLGLPFVLQAVRAGNVIKFYLNRVLYGTASLPLTAPTGGTSSFLALRTGTNPPELASLKINNFALSEDQLDADYMHAMGDMYGPAAVDVEYLWTGAVTEEGITVAAKLNADSNKVRLVARGSSPASTASTCTLYGPMCSSVSQVAKPTITGLQPDTNYTYQVEVNGELTAHVGKFKTTPAAGPASFKIAFSGDANSGSNAAVFDTIRNVNPLMFIHLGDMHYENIATNTPSLFNAAFDAVFNQPRQAGLYRDVPSLMVWDDHNYGPNNANRTSASHDAACTTYRTRVPHYPLADASPTGPIHQAFTVGRVLFLVTDQRSAASPDTDTDNASKTMLGASQKAWFKDQLDNAAGKLVVWVCPRVWGVIPQAGADHWGGFTTERDELALYAQAVCPGRLVILSADLHAMGIDDGTLFNFGGAAIKCFQAAPLDRTPSVVVPNVDIAFSEGVFSVNGVYGTMDVVDTGGSSLDVVWKGFNTAGTQLTSYSFTVSGL